MWILTKQRGARLPNPRLDAQRLTLLVNPEASRDEIAVLCITMQISLQQKARSISGVSIGRFPPTFDLVYYDSFTIKPSRDTSKTLIRMRAVAGLGVPTALSHLLRCIRQQNVESLEFPYSCF